MTDYLTIVRAVYGGLSQRAYSAQNKHLDRFMFFASLKSPLLQNKFPRHRVGNFIPQIS